jgi:hypothetical protein
VYGGGPQSEPEPQLLALEVADAAAPAKTATAKAAGISNNGSKRRFNVVTSLNMTAGTRNPMAIAVVCRS